MSLGSEKTKVERDTEPLEECLPTSELGFTENSVVSGSLKLNLPFACNTARLPPAPEGEEVSPGISPLSSFSEPIACRDAYTEEELKYRAEGMALKTTVMHASQFAQMRATHPCQTGVRVFCEK